MRYFGTGLTLVLAGMRLRIRIDLDDDPEDLVQATGGSTHVHHNARRSFTSR